ncbi:cell division protease FtsH [Cytobacillus eiseniae]|uniref:Cell division protease FtsH n=1 Tax=Cytobacillus eiseniae TaxID=762947 RepID=A0ABS4R9Z3_9BACI|nr:AAA family ATPase [Cytobacillus eiseniae]MBP2239718.1 cell division protease FtsH [Cytobacillus eiseniae]
MKLNLKKASTIVPIIVGLLVIATAIFTIVQNGNKSVTIPFSSVEELIESQNGKMVTINEQINGKLTIITGEGEFISHVPPNSQMIDKLVENYHVEYTFSSNSPYTPWILGGLVILIIAIGIYLYKTGKGGLGAANTMKQSVSKAKPLSSISLADVGGIQGEMKDEIMQTLSILKEPERALQMGLKPPKGILLYGPPGTGKTLLAQAIAKELGATFFSTSGSAFNEMFVGVGASRVRTLFQNARKQKPAVVFIDEVDALAGKRKQHGGEESEKTLTELLVQLDGGHSNDGILFIAATNRKDMLDDAFLRPGRIDFSFHVPLPDMKGRKEIIEIHTRNRKLAENVMCSLEDLAESTSGFSGADLQSLFETASRRAVQNGQKCIMKEDIDFALDRTVLGSSTRALQDAETKRRVAIHESGHALVAAITKPGSVRKATIIPRGQALGYVAPVPKEMHLSTTTDMLDQVAMILAGGVAERMILGEHSIGVGGDVQQAKQVIEQMVDTGLLDDGFTLTFNKSDKEVKMQELFQKALEKSEMLIRSNRSQFDKLVEALLKKETLEGAEVQEIADSTLSVDEKELILI